MAAQGDDGDGSGDGSDAWAALAGSFVDDAYASAKGRVRTYVMYQQLLDHLPPAPAPVLDVGGGAGHQSVPLARLGHPVTLLDASPTMLDRARQRLAAEPAEVAERVTLVEAAGQDALAATGGRRFAAVLCHGVLMYVDDPAPLVTALCACCAPGGMVSILALNAAALSVRPAVEGRWSDALAAFDQDREEGVLGVATRADTVAGLAALLRAGGLAEEAWYGVWLFADWVELPAPGSPALAVAADVELAASRRDPYRGVSRVFHLVGRRPAPSTGLAGAPLTE